MSKESDLGNKKIMSDNIKRYLEKSGYTRAEFAKIIKVPYTTFTDWLNGNRYPRIDKIEIMADKFHCSKSDLIEEFDPSIDMRTREILYETAKKAAELEYSMKTTVEFRNEKDKRLYQYLMLIMADKQKRELLEAFVKGLSIED